MTEKTHTPARPNGFTHGYKDIPFEFKRGEATKPTTKFPQRFKRGGFGANNGTIPGMGKK